MSLQLTPVSLSEYPAIAQLNLQGQPGVSPLDSAEFARILAVCRYAWLWREGAEPVAYMLVLDRSSVYDGQEFVWFCQRDSAPFYYIDQLAVAATYRGQGVGAQCYQRLQQQAMEDGVGRLVCEVNAHPPNLASMALHQRVGFVPCGQMVTRGVTVNLLQYVWQE